MRVMVLVKPGEGYEEGQMPKQSELETMGAFNEELVKAGIMLAADGLHPSSKGKRVVFGGEGVAPTVLDGPFAETKELIGGYWIWEVATMEEATEWLKRAPFARGDTVELRPIFEAEDFGDELTPELREAEQRMRDEVASRQQ